MRWWERHCPTIATVSNFYPHGFEGNAEFKKLFSAYYRHCSLVLHFSPILMRKVRDEFPGAQHDRHLLVNPLNYADLLKVQKSRGPCRKDFGFSEQDFVVLVIGALRSWEEICLISGAFSKCKVAEKRLLMAGRYEPSGSTFQRRWKQIRWRFWLWRAAAIASKGYIPDEEMYRYLDTADVVIVPRLLDLASGIPALAMTFGTMVIAPSQGAYPDYLAGTENLLYEPGSSSSLAAALEKAARMDRGPIIQRNREVAGQWTGDKIVSDSMKALDRILGTKFA
jgi:glycosyltransferase involved in cell wall biosynthesis